MPISRRSFHRGLFSIVPATVLGRTGRAAPSNRINLAVIGTGGQGTTDLKGFLQDERVQVVAVCDTERESDRYNKKIGVCGREPARRLVDKAYGTTGCAVYEDFREVLARKDVDAVLIATPDHWHALIAIAAAHAKKHIYCEKPLSLTIEQGRTMVREITQSGITWQTGSQQRSDIHFRMACEFVRNGRIGEIKMIEVGLASQNRDNNGHAAETAPAPVPDGLNYEMWLGPAPEAPFCPARLHSNWRWIYDYSGGNLTDFGAHHLDIAQWGLNTEKSGPVEFYDFKATWPEPGGLYNTPPTFSFECRYANGVRMRVADKQSFGDGVKFIGEHGSIMVNRGKLVVDPQPASAPLGPNDLHLPLSTNHHRNFIDALVNGTTPVAPIETAHRSITIAHLGNIGLRLRREKLKWNPENEKILDDAEAQTMISRPMRQPWKLG
jgi:predicted dehydrogenase